jgi:putative SOS response-associated peptidase YedK
MCGRYALHAHPEVVALQFGLDAAPELEAHYNICPGTGIIAVRTGERSGRRAQLHRWGLIPAWAKDPAIGNKLANARAESIGERPAFREAFRLRRCLVPASGFYEWQSVAGRKQPYYLSPADGALFGLAGIAEEWQGPQQSLRSVALITTAPNELMRGIHDRMPVIVAPEHYGAWLDPAQRDPRALRPLLRAYPAERMRAHPVSARVNTPRHDDAQLIEPVTLPA